MIVHSKKNFFKVNPCVFIKMIIICDERILSQQEKYVGNNQASYFLIYEYEIQREVYPSDVL